MSTDSASAERQREYVRWVIRNETIEECARKLEWLVLEGRTINEAIPAIRALKEKI